MHRGKNFDGALIIKIPHAIRHFNFGFPLPYTHAESVQEDQFYQFMEKELPTIERNLKAPQGPAWMRGTLPVAPLLASLSTSRGLLLFKPRLMGHGLASLAKQFELNGNRLPSPIEEGLYDYYQFIQAAYQSLGISIDIRPPNLLWLAGETPLEKQQLALLGYNRAGFIAFEMSKVPGNQPNYIDGLGMSFGEYRELFVNYLKEILRERRKKRN